MSLISFVTRVHFADRVLEDALAEVLGTLGVRRPLLIADRDAPAEALDRVVDALPLATDAAILHLRAPTADAGSAFAAGACDGVLAVGGEAALTRARVAAARLRPAPPVVAVPTTTACVGLEPAVACAEASVTPAAILCDPTLTMAMSPARTAETGMDALGRCLEAWLGSAWNPPADGIALDGLRRAGANLARAVADGRDLDARREMMAAALDAGLAAQKGLGGLEALSRAVEAEAGLADRHGLLHAALAPALLAFNAPAAAGRHRAAAEALGAAAPGGSAEALSAALAALGARLGLPDRLDGLGLDAAALGRAAAAAAAHPASRTNPRRIAEADYLCLLAKALRPAKA